MDDEAFLQSKSLYSIEYDLDFWYQSLREHQFFAVVWRPPCAERGIPGKLMDFNEYIAELNSQWDVGNDRLRLQWLLSYLGFDSVSTLVFEVENLPDDARAVAQHAVVNWICKDRTPTSTEVYYKLLGFDSGVLKFISKFECYHRGHEVRVPRPLNGVQELSEAQGRGAEVWTLVHQYEFATWLRQTQAIALITKDLSTSLSLFD